MIREQNRTLRNYRLTEKGKRLMAKDDAAILRATHTKPLIVGET
jgi:predicted transcriptional regulator